MFFEEGFTFRNFMIDALAIFVFVVWFWLLKRYVAEGPREHDAEPAPPPTPGDDEVAPLSFAY